MSGWMTIPAKLKDAGFTVCYERMSYEASNPLWRATAHRDGRTWSAMGKDLETALLELETQTGQAVANGRKTSSLERTQSLISESPVMAWQP
jgi:hypothetical protein